VMGLCSAVKLKSIRDASPPRVFLAGAKGGFRMPFKPRFLSKEI
jgi:hypothetical protein